MPAKNAPAAPIPVQIVSAVPSGNICTEDERKQKLVIIVSIVTALTVGLIKPSDCFIKNAQTISKIPAATNVTQAVVPP
jgi:hypothetical protein